MILPFYIANAYETSLTEEEIKRNFDGFVEPVKHRFHLRFSAGRDPLKTHQGHWGKNNFIFLANRKPNEGLAFTVVVTGRVRESDRKVEVVYRMPASFYLWLFTVIFFAGFVSYQTNEWWVGAVMLFIPFSLPLAIFFYKLPAAKQAVNESLLKPVV